MKNKLNEEMGFIKNNNYKVITLNEEYCEIEGLITEESKNPYGIVHGGYIFGLADTAAGHLAVTKGKCYTLDGSIDFLRPSTGSKIIGKCHFIRSGKTIANLEVEIFDEENIMTAKARFNYFYFE